MVGRRIRGRRLEVLDDRVCVFKRNMDIFSDTLNRTLDVSYGFKSKRNCVETWRHQR